MQIIERGSKLWQLSTCSIMAFLNYIQVFMKIVSIYIHRRSADTNLVEIYEEISELLDKQVNVQKDSLKELLGFMQALASPRKVYDEKERRKKRLLHKNFCIERKDFIRSYQKNG